MDKNNIKKIKELGQFYTKKEVAEYCFSILKNTIPNFINNNTKFIEPSAGIGNFISVIKKDGYKIKGFDIDPKNSEIEQKDFLKNTIPYLKRTKKNNIIIGNPPFGKRSKLAIEFFNKATEYSNIIGFIVPNQFRKYLTQNKLHKDFKLIKEVELKRKSFYIIKSGQVKDYNVNCVFQIWIHKTLDKESKYKNLRIINKPPIKHKDFEMYQYNNTKQALKTFENDFDFGVLSQ